VSILIGTLTPIAGAFYDSPSAQATRGEVNAWIGRQLAQTATGRTEVYSSVEEALHSVANTASQGP
jgi:hypothetical protein